MLEHANVRADGVKEYENDTEQSLGMSTNPKIQNNDKPCELSLPRSRPKSKKKMLPWRLL